MRTAGPALAIALVLLAGCGGDDDESEPASTTEAEESTATELPAEEDFEGAGAERLKVKADWLTAGAGAIWGNWEATIIRIDPETGEQTDRIPIPESPCGSIAFGYGALWTQTCYSLGLARVDPKTLEVTPIPLNVSRAHNGNSDIGLGEGAVWVIGDAKGCEACVLFGVDPESQEVTHELEIEPEASSVAVGLGAVWVANPAEGTVIRIDPKSDEVISVTPIDGAPQHVIIGEGEAWVFDQLGGNVVRLDSEGEEAQVIEADMAGAPGAITTGNDSVWVRGPLTLLEEIDEETGEVLARYGPRSGGGGVLVSDGYVWVSRYEEEFEDILRLPIPAP